MVSSTLLPPPPPLKKNKTNTNFYTVLKDKNILIDNIHFVWEHNILKIMLMVSTSWLFQTL